MVNVILMVFILARGITPEAECCRTSSHLIEPVSGVIRSPGSALHSPRSGDLLPVSGIRSLVRPPDPELHANI